MTVLGIDPGSEQSAWVLWNGHGVVGRGKTPNEWVLRELADGSIAFLANALVIEEIASYGMAVGREVFQTVRWGAKFEQKALEHGWSDVNYMVRRDVKLHLCGSLKAKDSNIRQALIDRFGGKERAIGKKANPGPLHGLRADEWQALALAVTFHDQRATEALVKAAV